MPDLHEHDHAHGHDHAPPQPDEKIHGYFQLLGLALKELLVEKGIFTAEEMRAAIEARDAIVPAQGARVVARAWTDAAYKARLLADAPAAMREMGIDPGETRLLVVENTPDLHNVIVCTLCSCYP